jgi:hypothetical protein
VFTKAAIKRLPVSIRTKARWDVASRPQYLAGVLAAADEAILEGVREISVFEFGVAGGNGLLALGEIAAAVESETGIRIVVYGFDNGCGLPDLTGDYRDYPDHWKPGDYPMDEEALRRRLLPNTRLLIGNVCDTIPKYLPSIAEPVGFVAVDVDIYSSSRDVLRMFSRRDRNMLRRVFMYFDDIDLMFTHRFAGEQLAMDEFNCASAGVKIDSWRSIKKQRPFPEASWLNRMYIAHDLEAISQVRLSRPARVITVNDDEGNTG